MNKKTNHYTLMFIPENNGKPFTLRVHKNIVHSMFVFLIVFVSCLGVLLYKAGEIAVKLQMLYIVKLENEKLSIENKQLRQITDKFNKIEVMYYYLNKLANPGVSVNGKSSKNHDSTDKISDTQFLVHDNDTMDFSQRSSSSIPTGKEDHKSIPNIVPVDGWVTRQFTKDKDSSEFYHQGIDFAATLRSPIKATAFGFVEDIKNDPYLGLIITINHENGYTTKYGHCSQVLISKNDYVKKGQMIALVGNTGRSTAPHLHYELLKNGINIDPLKYLLNYK